MRKIYFLHSSYVLHKNTHFKKYIIASLFAFALLKVNITNAQQNAISSGGTATGTNGSATFTIGQIDYKIENNFPTSTIYTTQGVQQVYTNFTPLPIVFGSFKAECMYGNIVLNWEWYNSDPEAKLQIQRSNDAGNNWETIATVNETSSFYTDKNNTNEQLFYRLMQNENGKNTFSNTVQIIGCNQEVETITYYPNPCTDGVFVRLQSKHNFTYNIINDIGTIVQQGTINGIKDFIPLRDIASGHYIVQFTNKKTYQIQIIKQ